MTTEEFYEQCTAIINVAHQYEDNRPGPYKRWDRHNGVFYQPMTRATRWGGRTPGNGRFVGIGLVRDFGSHVHVALSHPVVVNQIFATHEGALTYLRTVFAN